MTATLVCGHVLDVLPTLKAGSVQCCVTSPPYWGLRDYGGDDQIGLEPTVAEYVEKMVAVFRAVRRVLADDGTLWLNLGDCYATGAGSYRNPGSDVKPIDHGGKQGYSKDYARAQPNRMPQDGLKPKDLVGMPWRVAFALQADGWWLRSDIIWSKPNPMPESVTDRPTKSHEYLFLLTKSARYFYDAGAIRTADKGTDHPRHVLEKPEPTGGLMSPHQGIRSDNGRNGTGANARTVWEIATAPYPEAHFATFPPEIPKRCIAAGSSPGDTVIDPFGGSGTTAMVATGMGRKAVHIDLNPAYLELARQRIGPLLVAP